MSDHALKYFRFNALLQREDWLAPAYVGVDSKGAIRYLSTMPDPNGAAVEAVNGFAIPGFQNAHSHAFQFAMAGLAENHPAGTDDDFWTWREQMYKCALMVDPDDAEAIAAMLYAEMLRHGYTHVAEFHYLHHDKDGKHYANLAEMGERMVSAATTVGIKITLIPVFYQKGGFGLDPQPRQKRFISNNIDEYFKLLEASKRAVGASIQARLGFSVHSLRAVNFEDIIGTFNSGPKDLPFHLHVAEQKKEINDCLAFCGKRPMQWLYENLNVNERFFLVHATHLDDGELKAVASSNANVVLCPSTEGNLGDGIFRMKEYASLNGRWCIGTDSHIGLNPLEEFRMIDYRQRLVTNHRNTFAGEAAKYLVNEEVSTGRKAMGIQAGDHFAPGQSFDALIIDGTSPLIASSSAKNVLSTIIYTQDPTHNLGTIVNGNWIVRNNLHKAKSAIAPSFSKAISRLKNR
jgi:formimidoylglutamate deiminase